MRLQPLTVIFIGLFVCSVGINVMQRSNYNRLVKEAQANVTRIIIFVPDKDVKIKPPEYDYFTKKGN